MRTTPLPQRGLLLISGDDTADFLQGLISNDIKKLAPGKPLYAALLTPQGKYLFDFFLIQTPEGVLLDGEKDRLPKLQQLLTLYKLRSKVSFTPKEGSVIAAWGEGASAGVADPRLPELGFRLYGETAPSAWEKATPADYDAMRIGLGVPDGSDFITDKTFLLEAHFEALHGVDFSKGCYVGQEVTARSKFRGQVKKSFYHVESTSELPAPGTPVLLGDEAVGELRSHHGANGIAILRNEAVAKAAGSATGLTAAGQKITAISPAWATA